MIMELIPVIDPSNPQSPHVSSQIDSDHDSGDSGECPPGVEDAQRVPQEPGDRAAGDLPPPRDQGPAVMSRPPGPGHLSGHTQPQNIKVFSNQKSPD